jgi:hypothetical protein
MGRNQIGRRPHAGRVFDRPPDVALQFLIAKIRRWLAHTGNFPNEDMKKPAVPRIEVQSGSAESRRLPCGGSDRAHSKENRTDRKVLAPPECRRGLPDDNRTHPARPKYC